MSAPLPSSMAQLLGASQASFDQELLARVSRTMARGLRDVVAEFGAGKPEIAVLPLRTGRCEDVLKECAPVSGFCRIAMPPLRTGVGAILPAPFIAQLIDLFYGGSGEIGFDRAHLTGAEKRILHRFGESLAKTLASSWAGFATAPASLAKSWGGLEDALFPDGEDVAVQAFKIEDGICAGVEIAFLYPVAGLRGLQAQPLPSDASAAAPSDCEWRDQLIDATLQIRLPVRAVFARIDLPLTDLLALAPGDLIPLCLPQRVPVIVGDRCFAEATIGEANGRTSILIEAMQKGMSEHD